jgi:hypothetical protein
MRRPAERVAMVEKDIKKLKATCYSCVAGKAQQNEKLIGGMYMGGVWYKMYVRKKF